MEAKNYREGRPQDETSAPEVRTALCYHCSIGSHWHGLRDVPECPCQHIDHLR